MVDCFLTVHDPVAFRAEFEEVSRLEAREDQVGCIVLHVRSDPQAGGIEGIKEGVAAKVGIRVAIAEGVQRRCVGHVRVVTHHRLRPRPVVAARKVSRIVITEKIRVASVTAVAAPAAADAI